MRALVVSIWVFINLVFFGMCGYMYLLWSQYWMYVENSEPTVNKYDQQIYYYNRGYTSSYFNETKDSTDAKNRTKHSAKDNSAITIIKNSKPRFPNIQTKEFIMDNAKSRCSRNDSTNECDIKIFNYKERILNELKRVFMDEGSTLKNKNRNNYDVQYQGPKGNHFNSNPRQLLCEFKQVDVKILTREDFSRRKHALKEHLPKRKFLENKRYKKCAVIASAGSLKHSNMGAIIDSHDLVLRFNHAPTVGYEADVGNKTNVRIVNSQVVSKEEFRFLQSEMYRNITLLAWDPMNYTATLEEWYKNPEFDFFGNYIAYRKMYPKSKFFILNPCSLWKLWDLLQRNSPHRLRRNPPSSGFLGLAVLLPHCDYVNIFEYIPSLRVTKRCHYYDTEDNPACTFGVWHPLAAEKLFTYSMNVANDRTVFSTGYVQVPGFSKLQC